MAVPRCVECTSAPNCVQLKGEFAPNIELAIAAETANDHEEIVYAAAVRVEALWPEVDELLRQMAHLFKEPNEPEDDWLDYVFVSDESHLADFLSADSELAALRERLAMPELAMRDSICNVALALRGKKNQQTIQ
jgi:hypothetical protein